jgi:hypothetical protein
MQPHDPQIGRCTQCCGGLELKTAVARFGANPETRYFECQVCGKLYIVQKPVPLLEAQGS